MAISPEPRRYRGERRPRIRSMAFAGQCRDLRSAVDRSGGRAEPAGKIPKDLGCGEVYELRRFRDGAEGGGEAEPA